MNLVLYYAPIACSLVPFVTLTEAGATFEVRTIDLRRREQMSPEFLELNPKHKVPVLVVDGKPLTENVAIQLWIARTFPAAKLMPRDPWDELQAIAIHGWCSGGIHPYLSRLNAPSRVCDLPESEASVRRLAIDALHDNFRVAEDRLEGREFLFEHFTAADAHFFWCFRRAMLLEVDLSSFPACMAHFERMLGRSSVQKVVEFEDEVRARFARAG